MSTRYKKNIACLESLWDHDIETRLTVAPILELVATMHYAKVSHMTCNTVDELKFNLRSLPARGSERILYLAFHGGPGLIELGDGTAVSLEELASWMGRRFSGWVIHFGACSTLEVKASRLAEFCGQTESAMLLGYQSNIDWIESAALDLILLDQLERYKSLSRMWTHVCKTYPDLVKRTGLTVFPER